MDELEVWPVDENNKTQHILGFTNTINFNITGSGTIDGQGYLWWVRTIVTAYDNRPNMLNIELGLNTIISGITMRNSPQYHMYLDDMLNLDVHSVTIRVSPVTRLSLLFLFVVVVVLVCLCTPTCHAILFSGLVFDFRP